MHNALRWLAPAVLTAALVIGTPPAQAQHHDGGYYDHDYHGHDYHGRDYGRFSPVERDRWRGGRWEHGWHDGRFGWWWTVGGGWDVYPGPVYPYPTSVL